MALTNAQKVAEHRRRNKAKLIELHGGACQRCGYDKCYGALHFHHRDPSTKLFGLSAAGITRSWKSIVAEAEKCELICANCHAEQHWSLAL